MQNNNQATIASVKSGGEGQKFVAVLLQAKAVTNLNYTVSVYGNSAALMPSLGLIASLIFYVIYANKQ